MISPPRKELADRLARIEGQLRALQRQLHEDNGMDDCAQVAQQMAAARKALDKAFYVMLGCALEHKGSRAKTAGEIAAHFKEISALLAKYA